MWNCQTIRFQPGTAGCIRSNGLLKAVSLLSRIDDVAGRVRKVERNVNKQKQSRTSINGFSKTKGGVYGIHS